MGGGGYIQYFNEAGSFNATKSNKNKLIGKEIQYSILAE